MKAWPWFAALGLGIATGTIAALRKPSHALSGSTPTMLKLIAQEARSPAEFARRAEAWNAAEAKPLSITLLAKAYRGAKPGVTAQLIREAHETRIEQRERLWSKMSKGLRGPKKKASAAPQAVAVGKLFAWAPKVRETITDVEEGRTSRSNDQPIRVSRLDNGGYWIIDGHHRVVEAVRRGDATVSIVVDEHVPRIERTGGAYAEVLANRVNVAKSAK